MSFKRLDPEDISISAESVVAPCWSTGQVELASASPFGFFTSNGQKASNTGNFYYEVSHRDTTNAASRVQFAVAYGHKTGAGSVPYNSNVAQKSPSATIYGQYRNLVFGDEDTDFTFGTGTSDDIYVISVDRARYKEKLFPGTFNITLRSGSAGIHATTLHLTDNSNDISTVSFVDAGRVYDIISGSDGTGANVPGGTGLVDGASYGKFLPDVGVIIFNGTVLNLNKANKGLDIKTSADTTSAGMKNHEKLVDAITLGNSFKLQSEETISSNFVFVRVRNSEFNYSTNPSNITSSGELRHNVMINTPQAYITTVGLYNDDNDLLGVAKLSRPLLKDFTKEALVRIKLDY